MPSKSEIVASLDQNNYSKAHVKSLVESVTNTGFTPNKFKKGDIIVLSKVIMGNKPRPGVVIKVLETTLIVLPITTCEDHMILSPCKDRFLDQHFSKAVTTVSIEYAKDKFIGVFENIRGLNKAIKELQRYILTI